MKLYSHHGITTSSFSASSAPLQASILRCDPHPSITNRIRPTIRSTSYSSYIDSHTYNSTLEHPFIAFGHMGIYLTCCTKKEDVSPEEASEVHGWQGIEGRYKFKQVLCLWECQEGALTMPVLRSRYWKANSYGLNQKLIFSRNPRHVVRQSKVERRGKES